MFELINDLSESKSFRNRDSLAKLEDQRSLDLLFAHVAVCLTLMQEDDYKEEVIKYVSKAITFGNFDFFRSSGNDLYALCYRQKDNKYFNQSDLIRVCRSAIMGNYGILYSYLNKLNTSLGVKNNNFSKFKRYASYWNRVGDHEKKRALEMVMIDLRRDMPNSELSYILRRT